MGFERSLREKKVSARFLQGFYRVIRGVFIFVVEVMSG